MDHPAADNPYAPPIAPVRWRRAVRSQQLVMYAQAVVTGLILGLIDIHMNNVIFLLIRLGIYCAVAGFQGWRYGTNAVVSVLVLGSSLAPIQMVAISSGYLPPYVCPSQATAAGLLILNVPCFVAFAVGRGIRLARPPRFGVGT